MLYFPTVEELKSDHIPEGTYTTGIDGSLMKGGAEEHIGLKMASSISIPQLSSS